VRKPSLLLAAWLLLSPAARADDALAEKAWTILRTHCAACHSGGNAKGGFDYLLDRERLVSRNQLVPGKASDSPLFQRVQQGEMPPPSKKVRPSNDEVAALQRWIGEGAHAPKSAETPAVPVTTAAIPALILADLQSLEPRQRRFTRYLTLTHLLQARLPAEDLQRHHQAIAKLVNSLSWHSRITKPKTIDPAKTIYRLDLRDYRWTARQWDRLATTYPYRLGDQSEAGRESAKLAGCDVPQVRGDWFVATASRPPFYYDFVQIPLTDRGLERLLQVDLLANLQDDNAMRAGFNGSGVARNNRLIERHDAVHGAYWRSYDFSDNTGRQNLFEHPLGPGNGANAFAQAGGEIIFNLPNGLQGYMLVNGDGQRVDKAPGEIVSDPKRPDRLVEAGVSCMSCHVKGLHPKDDQVRAHVSKNANAFPAGDRAVVKALYVPTAKFRAALNEDAERFAAALAKTGVTVNDAEPIEAVTLRYEAVLDLTSAAAESGLPTEEFAGRLRRSPALTRTLGALLARGGTVQRQVFQETFADLARTLDLDRLTVASQPGTMPTTPFEGQRGAMRGLAFSHDGKTAATGGEDRTIRIWDLPGGKEKVRLEGHTQEVTCLTFSADGKHLLSGGRDRVLRLWDTATGREVRRFSGHTDGVRSVVLTPDGRFALSGGEDRTVRVWEIATGQELRGFSGHTGTVTSLALSRDGKLVASGSLDRTVRLWEVGTGALRARWDGHTGAVYSVAFSPDGKHVVSGGNDRILRLWEIGSEKEVRRFSGHANAVVCVAFSPDGKHILSASSQYQTEDRIIRVWNRVDGTEVGGREGGANNGVECVAFSRDCEQTLLSHAVSGLRLWVVPKVR
jgi:mono/diheme cytochrome c family protein